MWGTAPGHVEHPLPPLPHPANRGTAVACAHLGKVRGAQGLGQVEQHHLRLHPLGVQLVAPEVVRVPDLVRHQEHEAVPDVADARRAPDAVDVVALVPCQRNRRDAVPGGAGFGTSAPPTPATHSRGAPQPATRVRNSVGRLDLPLPQPMPQRR